MILFNITFNIEKRINDQWLKWIKMNFIPMAMKSLLPKDIKIFKLLTEIGNEGNTYTVQFSFKNREDFFNFELNHKEKILDRHLILFRGKFVEFSSLLEEVI